MKLLCQAEAFGFGPAAAIAQISHGLNKHYTKVDYAGEKHTFSAQQVENYHAMHDLKEISLEKLVKEYDYFLTAMDWEAATIAKKAGLKVIFYDALAWYWKHTLDFNNIDVYIAQNFLGVETRLKEFSHPSMFLVPPLIKKEILKEESLLKVPLKPHISLGGLLSPEFNKSYALAYANLIAKATEHSIEMATNTFIAETVPCAKALTWQENQAAFTKANKLLITPGLGNILEANAANADFMLLPPVNDSQGMQLNLLKNHDAATNSIDWHEFLENDPIEYELPQSLVMNMIKANLVSLQRSKEAQAILKNKLTTFYAKDKGASVNILDFLGNDGNKQVNTILQDIALKNIA